MLSREVIARLLEDDASEIRGCLDVARKLAEAGALGAHPSGV